jgi:hypothetical protein
MTVKRAPLAAGPRDRAAAVCEVSLSAYDTAGLRAPRELLAGAAAERRLADELLAMPPARRLAAAAHERRFRRAALARLLVLDAEAALFERGSDARPAAGAAAAIAAALAGESGGGRAAREAAGRAWWLLGKGELRAGCPEAAAEAFQAMLAAGEPSAHGGACPEAAAGAFETILGFGGEGAAAAVAAAPATLAALAALAPLAALARVGLAQAAEDLGRPEEAAALWLGATQAYAEIGAAAGGAACQAQLGLLLAARGDLENGEVALRLALSLLDAAFAPSLAARLWLALAEIAAAGGAGGLAERRRERARRLYELAPGPEEAMVRAASEARIAALLGAGARAADLLEGVRPALLAEGSLKEAVGLTLELLLLRIESDRFDAVVGLTGELAQAFPGVAEGWAAELDGLALAAIDRPRSVYRRVAAMRERLRRVPETSRERPPLLTSARALCDRVLLGRGEGEDPIGAATGL